MKGNSSANVGFASFLRCIESAKITLCVFMPNNRIPLLALTPPMDPAKTAFIVSPQTLGIRCVLDVVGVSEIAEDVVHRVAIDMIDENRGPLTGHIQPRQAMSFEHGAVDSDRDAIHSAAAAGDLTCIFRVPRIRTVVAISPSKDAGVGVVVEDRPHLFGRKRRVKPLISHCVCSTDTVMV